MKRTVSLAASQPNRMRKSYRRMCTVVSLLLMLIASVGSANAQSKDRDNPTRLTSNEISGSIDSTNVGDNYHYTFVAGPGEVTIILSVEAGQGVNAQDVIFNLFDPDAREISTGSVMASGGRTEQVVKRINITRRQPVLLRIILRNSYGAGRYRLRLSGAVHFDPGKRLVRLMKC